LAACFRTIVIATDARDLHMRAKPAHLPQGAAGQHGLQRQRAGQERTGTQKNSLNSAWTWKRPAAT